MSRFLFRVGAGLALGLAVFGLVAASPVPARLGDSGALIADDAGEVTVTVPLDRPVPWRLHTLDAPPRLVVEFNELHWSSPPTLKSASVAEAGAGRFTPGWSRLVAVLREPLEVATAEMRTLENGAASLDIRLVPTTADRFRETATRVTPEFTPGPKRQETGRPLVVIDAGHGGIDPGAEANGLKESDLTLGFARRLRGMLLEGGQFDVLMTRDDDVFVPLEERLTRARSAGATVFLSLHADALEPETGRASGMTVYTLAEDFSDEASRRIAERHAQGDILAGVNLAGAGDDVARALLDLARLDTQPRTDSLSRALVGAFRDAGLAVNSRPERQGNFAVLQSAEIPSVLVELGFLSSRTDRTRLASEDWQTDAGAAIRNALLLWYDEDRLRSPALRH